jgi:hypothetical protein
VSDTELPPFTRSVRYRAAICCATAKRTRNRRHQIASTPNRTRCNLGAKKRYKVILVGHQIADTANRIYDMQQIAHEIAYV